MNVIRFTTTAGAIVLATFAISRAVELADRPRNIVVVSAHMLHSLSGRDQQTTYVADPDDTWDCDHGQLVEGSSPAEDCNTDDQPCYFCDNNSTFEGYITNVPSMQGGYDPAYPCGILWRGFCTLTAGVWDCAASQSDLNCSNTDEPQFQIQ